MDFAKTVIGARLLKPPLFEEEAHIIEYRKDPLTGAPCRLNAARMARLAVPPAKPDISEITGKQTGCAFCPENLEQDTPLFPPDLCPEGRISVGECCLFPNLFPLAQYHATATLTTKHFLDLDQFHTQMVIDSLCATKRYLIMVQAHSTDVCYPIYLWNHLPPSAASMIHPHVQILVDGRHRAHTSKGSWTAARSIMPGRGTAFGLTWWRKRRDEGRDTLGPRIRWLPLPALRRKATVRFS